jgi:hypothetical protein
MECLRPDGDYSVPLHSGTGKHRRWTTDADGVCRSILARELEGDPKA